LTSNLCDVGYRLDNRMVGLQTSCKQKQRFFSSEIPLF